MNIGVVFALITAFLWTTYNVVARKLSVKSTDPLAFSCLYPLCAGIITSLIFLLQPDNQPITADWRIVLVTIFAMMCYSVFDVLQFFTYKHLEISYRTIVTQVTPVITFLAAITVLQESITLTKIMGILCIVGGNIFALYKHSLTGSSKFGIRLVLITSVALGLAYIGDKVASPYYPIWFYISLAYFSPWLVTLIVSITLRGKQLPVLIKAELKRASWRIPVLALLGAGGYYFFLKSFALIGASVATPIVYTATILTVLAGILILNEKADATRKLVAAVVVFIGVILLAT